VEADVVTCGVLGPLAAWRSDGSMVELGGRKQKVLLATLLFADGAVVPVHRLGDVLWGEQPPKSWLSNLHTYLSRLRVRLPEMPPERVDGGYRLPSPAGCDLHRFRDAVAVGRRALRDADHEVAATSFRSALATWRGTPLAGLVVPALEAQIDRLQQERLAVFEDAVEAEFALGRHASLVGELRSATSEEPYRERLWAQLMTAEFRSGQRAAALASYRKVRGLLVAELGIEPGHALQHLQSAILTGDSRSPVVAGGFGRPPRGQAHRDVVMTRPGVR
jgi:DNA-binding SARP family transcriptional activator